MRRIFKSIGKLMIALLMIAMCLPSQTYAAGAIDIASHTSLTINFSPEDTPAEGTEFQLYRVADVTRWGRFMGSAKFVNYQLDFEDMTEESWREMSATLQGYIAADKIAADATAKVDEKGVATFENLPVGLYLVTGDVFHANGKYYTPQAFMICLPNLDETTNSWQYNVETNAKYESQPDGLIDLEILKVWKDNDYSGRPSSVTVEVYEGSELYKTVILNSDNNWRCQLTDLDGGSVWSVVEKDIPVGYQVVVEYQTQRIVINNVKPEEPETPKTPEEPDEPDTPEEPSEEEITQTGVLWWPVSVLSAAGLMLIVAGYLRRRGSENEN